MKKANKILSKLLEPVMIISGLTLLLICSTEIYAQEKPPHPNSVSTLQNLNFGAFFQGISGGTVIIYPDGSRLVNGDIIGANLGIPYNPAIFELDSEPGVLFSIVNGPDAVLTGSNGGSMILHLGESDPHSPFIVTSAPPGRTQVRVGGTLIVGSPLANPAGIYNCTFTITFNQE